METPHRANETPLTETERRFVDDVARLLVPWGVPQTAARLYGYLLLRPEPVSLDRITVDLQVSKSSASVAARLLEMYTLVRRHGERGSRHVLLALGVGITEAEIQALSNPSATWSDADAALLHAVDEVCSDDCMSDETWAAQAVSIGD